jgi:hypothetical protein
MIILFERIALSASSHRPFLADDTASRASSKTMLEDISNDQIAENRVVNESSEISVDASIYFDTVLEVK